MGYGRQSGLISREGFIMAQQAIRLIGAKATETASILCRRLVELGHAVKAYGTEVVFEGTSAAKALEVTLLPQDSPAFAAEKILDTLETEGLIRISPEIPSSEEDTEIQDRLRHLGYIE